MKKKMVCKIAIDVVMTVLLLFLMARQITGDSAHEWLGAGMFVLWIAHHILNRSWYSHLCKGRYTPVRIIQTLTNAAVLFSMLVVHETEALDGKGRAMLCRQEVEIYQRNKFAILRSQRIPVDF